MFVLLFVFVATVGCFLVVVGGVFVDDLTFDEDFFDDVVDVTCDWLLMTLIDSDVFSDDLTFDGDLFVDVHPVLLPTFLLFDALELSCCFARVSFRFVVEDGSKFLIALNVDWPWIIF